MAGRLTARWIPAMLALALAAPGLAVGDEADQPWIRGIFTGRSPRAEKLPAEAVWRDVQDRAGTKRNALVLLGTGRSMQPLYPAGTWLVLQAADYDSLQSGQTVIYRNRAGRAVAHVLITRARDGWRARGLNNRLHDMEPVLPGNLLGVVVAAFVPQEYRSILPPRESRFALFLADD